MFNKIHITGSAIFDPYQVNSQGFDINKLVWNKDLLTLGRLTSATLAFSTQFKGGDKSKSAEQKTSNMLNQPYNPASGLPQNEYDAELGYINTNPGLYTDFNIPWSISFSYSFNYTKSQNGTYNGLAETIAQNVTGNGSLGLSPKWQLSANTSYNITQKQLGMLSMSLSRDLHCWALAISVSPVGTYHFFSINISPKSPLLQDLKVNRSRYYNVY